MNRTDAEPIGAVLPLRVRRRRGAEIIPRCHILFSSLAKFAEPGLFDEIHVVVPQRDRADVERLCDQWSSLPLVVLDGQVVLLVERLCDQWSSLPLVVLDEKDYLPALGRHRVAAGWYRQQVIKLRAAERLKAPFFLTLDDDVVLCKPLRRADALPGGRALLEPNPRTAHPDWWTGAAQLLGLAVDLSAPSMFVTPAILARSICSRLFEDLERCHDRAWDETLLRHAERPWMPAWSEYALYYLAGEAAGMLGTSTRLPAPIRRSASGARPMSGESPTSSAGMPRSASIRMRRASSRLCRATLGFP